MLGNPAMQQQQQHSESVQERGRTVPPMTLKEFEMEAARRVHPVAWRYVSFNAGGLTGKLTRKYLDRLRLRTRVLRDVSQVDTSVTLCDGSTLPFPLIIAPTAFHKLFHPDGEVLLPSDLAFISLPLFLILIIIVLTRSWLLQGRHRGWGYCIATTYSWPRYPCRS